jgi:RimJ/RimL family protein N-acetyltransferase
VRSGLANMITPAANKRKHITFGIWQGSSERFLGEVGLYSVDYQRGVGQVGYWLRQAARGNGYVSEAAQIFVDHARSTLRLRRLEAHVAAENLASRRVVE